MTFKEYLLEKAAMATTKRWELISSQSVPLTSEMMDRLGYSYQTEAWHVTNSRHLKGLTSLKPREAISAFTKGGYSLARLPSQPNVLIKIKGNVLIEAQSDAWTSLADDGKRWIWLRHRSGKITKLRKYIHAMTGKIMAELGDTQYGEIEYDNIGALQGRLLGLSQKDLAVLYKEYNKQIEKLLNKEYNLLNDQLKNYITNDYNELVMNHVKVIEGYCIENESPDVVKEINKYTKYKGVKTWDQITKLK